LKKKLNWPNYRDLSFGYTFEENREVVSMIFINYFLGFLFSGIALTLTFTEEELLPATYRYHALIIVAIVNLLMIRKGWVNSARFILLVVLPLFLLVLPPVAGIFDNEFYFWFPYVPVAISIIPHFILNYRKELWYLIIVLICYFPFTFLSDNLMRYFSGGSEEIVPIVVKHSFYYNLVPILIYAFVNTAIGLLFGRITRNEYMLKLQKRELDKQNQLLSEQQGSLLDRNKKLDQTLKRLYNTQSRLIQSEKMAALGNLTSGIAHEINNPLNFISVSLEEMERLMDDMTTQRELSAEEWRTLSARLSDLFSYAREGSERATEIVSRLGALKSGDTYEPSNTNLTSLLNDTVELYRKSVPEGCRIELKVEFDHSEVYANREMLGIVFGQILKNAIEAITETDNPAARSIRVVASREELEDHQVISVEFRNDGPLIPEPDISKLFDPFFSTKQQSVAPGLGLTDAYNIVKRYNGEISAYNEGKWAVFKVRLPLRNPDLN